jgi:hypothetical protein
MGASSTYLIILPSVMQRIGQSDALTRSLS